MFVELIIIIAVILLYIQSRLLRRTMHERYEELATEFEEFEDEMPRPKRFDPIWVAEPGTVRGLVVLGKEGIEQKEYTR
jgi:hypothetical protein